MVGSFARVRSATFTLYLTPIIPLFLEKRKYNQHVTVVFGRFSATDFDSAAKSGRTWGRGAKIVKIVRLAARQYRGGGFLVVSFGFHQEKPRIVNSRMGLTVLVSWFL